MSDLAHGVAEAAAATYTGKAIVRWEGRKFRSWMDSRTPPTRYTVADKPRIEYAEIKSETTRNSPIGPITSVRGTGRWNKQHLDVSGDSRGLQIAATAEGVKSLLRRIRQREAEEIAEADARIARLKVALEQAQADRQAALGRAFSNGHVFTLAEAKAIADANLEAFEARKATKE